MKGRSPTWGRGFLWLLLLWLLQLALAGRARLWGVTPALLPLGTALAGAVWGGTRGGMFGIAGGIVWLLLAPGGTWWAIPVLCLVGLAAGLGRGETVPRLWTTLGRTALGLLLWEGSRLLLCLPAVTGGFGFAGREFLWTLPWCIPLYPLLRRLGRRRKEGGSHGEPGQTPEATI